MKNSFEVLLLLLFFKRGMVAFVPPQSNALLQYQHAACLAPQQTLNAAQIRTQYDVLMVVHCCT